MSMTSLNVHREVAVCIEDGKPVGMPWGPYESAFLEIDPETAWDNDADRWVEPESELNATADDYLAKVFEFPAAVIAVFREWTGPNGYDINIMSDVMGLLVEGGWVEADDPIVNGIVE